MSNLNKYYHILGIPPTTDINLLKKAYRKQAMQYHPDKNPSVDAQSKFIEITEAYEILTGQQKSPTQFAHTKSAQEVRAEKIKQAKRRYKKMQETEQEKDAQYYLKITTGFRWKLFRGLAYYSLIFGIILSIDYFATSKHQVVTDIPLFGYLPNTVVHDGELFEVNGLENWSTRNQPTQLNYSYFFADLKSINVIHEHVDITEGTHPSDRMKRFHLFTQYESSEFHSYASVYYLFPFYQLSLMLPFVLIRFRRPNINFSIGRLVSLWVLFPSVIYISFSNDRIFHLLGIL